MYRYAIKKIGNNPLDKFIRIVKKIINSEKELTQKKLI